MTYSRESGPIDDDTLRNAIHEILVGAGYEPDFVVNDVGIVAEVMDEEGRVAIARLSTKIPAWRLMGLYDAGRREAERLLTRAFNAEDEED